MQQQQQGIRKIELFLSCRNLPNKDFFSKSDPYIIIYTRISARDQWTRIGQTEQIANNLNPNFFTSFPLDYFFELKQEYRFEVRDDDGIFGFDPLGWTETTLGQIVGAPYQELIIILQGKTQYYQSQIILRYDVINECNQIIQMQWSGLNLKNVDWFGKSDPFFRISRVRAQGNSINVYQSEIIQNNLNPQWRLFEISVQKLCQGDLNKQISIECLDQDADGTLTLIGSCQFTLAQLQQGTKDFILMNKANKQSGTFRLNQFYFETWPGFLDYIRGGIQINLMIAVDFTKSNGEYQYANSLHYINPQPTQLNFYQQALKNVGEILLNYDNDKRVSCYGYGAAARFPNLTSPPGTASHCFPMTGDPNNPNVVGLEGIMQAYRNTLQHVILSGPTFFNPVIQQAINAANDQKMRNSNVYTVLLLLTDGVIHDLKETSDSIVQASESPISIVIVGIGDEDFKNMEILDGDSGLKNSYGVKAKRDIVQFVKYKTFWNAPQILSQAVLAEIPEQVTNCLYSLN